MTAARVMLVVATLTVGGYLLHRGMLAMERRGWIYYRSRGRASAGVTLGALDEVFHPSGQVTVVEQEEQERRGPRTPAPGDPPDPDGSVEDGSG